MRIRTRGRQAAITMLVAGSAIGLSAAPASALAVLTPVLKAPGTGPYSVSGGCTPVAGATLNLNQLTYVVEGTASASSTIPGVYAVSTGVTCTIKRVRPSSPGTVGSVSGVLPGTVAAAAGGITVQLSDTVTLCWIGTAHYSDNQTYTEPEKCS